MGLIKLKKLNNFQKTCSKKLANTKNFLKKLFLKSGLPPPP